MNFKGELVLHQKEDGNVQYRDDLSFMWCACGKGANNYFPENEQPYQFMCAKCAYGINCKRQRFWIPINLGFARTIKKVEGEYLGEHNRVQLVTHFDDDLCMHVVSELTSGYGITKSFKRWFAIEKAKQRIDKNKEQIDLWIKTNNAKYGALNQLISTK
ncbi:hypothetical protein P4I85_15230 [Bacillus cereus]|uniref:hypothetical protein n=1 Tax=Bacillus cereus group TaxID=86661 RepID=UPI001E6365B3|nr:hypothetical protein [Bacillus cereus group sp. BfR-BA-01317]MEB9422114.1 hypothetical protein [Bacillus cereus]MEB9508476.1 hypothetical protein [Bacillus cereus]MEB9561840.1 hypothetical protein [Bacillus cereus]MEC2466769.1 hypothetical protein [Bacillus cereus]